jgi:hypothetical protein
MEFCSSVIIPPPTPCRLDGAQAYKAEPSPGRSVRPQLSLSTVQDIHLCPSHVTAGQDNAGGGARRPCKAYRWRPVCYKCRDAPVFDREREATHTQRCLQQLVEGK